MDKEAYAVEDQAERDLRIAQARAAGFEVVFGDDMHLLLDIDAPEPSMQFMAMLPMIYDRFGAAVESQWKSKSGNTHIVMVLSEPLPILERIALQAMMGSDSKKEMMSMCSAKIGVDNPILLFKPQQAIDAEGR